MSKKLERPRNIANDILDCLEDGFSKWTKQKKSEERAPSNIRYRETRLTKSSRVTQKDAAWAVMKDAYMAASALGTLPALVRQIYYQARPKIMAMTDDKELEYNYFSQTLLPNYIEEHGVFWRVVYDARGHFEEPHTNRRIGCGTIEIDNYLRAVKGPDVIPAAFSDANVNVVGPDGGIAGILFCEKEGFGPLFKAVDLANRYDLMIISTKGVSVTAARKLINDICGKYDLPLFVLHDFDVAGFMISGTLQRDTRRFQFTRDFEVVDLGLRLDDIEGLEREPAAKSNITEAKLRDQLVENGATEEEIDILLDERVELNALTSDALVDMIERKLADYGLQKVVPSPVVLADTYRAFHRSHLLRKRFEELVQHFDQEAEAVAIPEDLEEQVRALLDEQPDLRWDDAVQVVLDETQLDRVRENKDKAKRKSGDFTSDSDDDEIDIELDDSRGHKGVPR